MRMPLAVAAAILTIATSCCAATYTVTNTSDSGTGSLRWAITQANSTSVSDTIAFDPSLSGATIQPLTTLPVVTKLCTINGDVNNDGVPDIHLDGTQVSGGFGGGIIIWLSVIGASGAPAATDPLLPSAPPTPVPLGCTIRGLAIGGFPVNAIWIMGGEHHQVYACNLGADLTGNVAEPCGNNTVYIANSRDCVIGGSTASRRNVVYCGTGTGDSRTGLKLYQCTGMTVIGNYVGVKRDGSGSFGTTLSNSGVWLEEGSGNTIGGKQPGERNVIAGAGELLQLLSETSDTVQGNYFGLAPDGTTSIPVAVDCITVLEGSTDNLIGGAAPAAANVICGGVSSDGVQFRDAATAGNRVQGNLIGSNAAGTEFRPLARGVVLTGGTGPQTIGGSTAATGNYIACTSTGVSIYGADGSTVRYNKIGLRQDGTPQPLSRGVELNISYASIRDNTIVRATAGIYCRANGEARAYGNTFRFCEKAVHLIGGLSQGKALLGNLSNAATNDDGGNAFTSNNTWFIYNETSNSVRAEGNSFGTTSAAAIDAKIWDRLDNAALGRVDFRPLAGGVMPTAAPLTVASAAAVPTDAGAEVVFSLSADATVTVEVLNMAGRVVAAPLRDDVRETGLQRIVWTRQTLSGTRAPSGLYLARITARTPNGETAQALCRVPLR